MAASAHVKKGDIVTVISGHESIKGKSGKVLQVIPKKGKVIIEGVHLIKKHQKASQTNQQGGIVQREGALHISKVRLSGDSVKEKKSEAPAPKAKAKAKKK
jgi:large subunit ribosomal protein L24